MLRVCVCIPRCLYVCAAMCVPPADTVECIPFPKHLRPFIPNTWGSKVTTGQDLFSMLEQCIFAKGCVVLSTRGLLDEELFVEGDDAAPLPLLAHQGYNKE